MTSTPKPREWLICDKTEFPDHGMTIKGPMRFAIPTEGATPKPFHVHVIEHSAYQAALSERDSWKRIYEENLKGATEVIAQLTKERDQALERAELAYDDGFLKGTEVGDATARRVRDECNKDLQRWQQERIEMYNELTALREKTLKLVGALKFYASCPPGSGMIEGQINGGEWIPLGEHARQILDQLGIEIDEVSGA
jgi:hypothetical protein